MKRRRTYDVDAEIGSAARDDGYADGWDWLNVSAVITSDSLYRTEYELKIVMMIRRMAEIMVASAVGVTRLVGYLIGALSNEVVEPKLESVRSEDSDGRFDLQ
jgi:hypothetical protein